MGISKEEIDELEQIIRKMSICNSEKHLDAYCKIDDQFHEFILNICGNKCDIKVRENLKNFIYRYRFKSLNAPGRLKDSLREHSEILDCLKQVA